MSVQGKIEMGLRKGILELITYHNAITHLKTQNTTIFFYSTWAGCSNVPIHVATILLALQGVCSKDLGAKNK